MNFFYYVRPNAYAKVTIIFRNQNTSLYLRSIKNILNFCFDLSKIVLGLHKQKKTKQT